MDKKIIGRFLALFLFWLLLCGKCGWFNIISGIIISFFITLLSVLLSGVSEVSVWDKPVRLWLLTLIFTRLVFEIIKSNIVIARIVLNPALPISPGVIKFKTDLKSDLAKVILANTITLTPGTLTVEIDGQNLAVHTLLRENLSDLLENRIEHLLHRMEEG